MLRPSLDLLFRDALLLALGASVLSGCSEEGIENDPDFVAAACTPERRPVYLDGLSPADPVDYPGDEVVSVTTFAELRELLAPIDTPAEAVLLGADGYSVRRGGRSGSRPVADGYEAQLLT